MVSSPRCILNCQALSIHLPPLRDPGDTSARGKYLTPPMSASPGHSQFGDPHQTHQKGRHEQTLSPTSVPTYSSKQSPESVRTSHSTQSQSIGQVRTPIGSPGVRTSAHQTDASLRVQETSNDELISINQDSPELHHLTAGPPGVARRAKAHVPSACVNCKRKHLACETRRPCNRCVQTGKEVRMLKILLHGMRLLIVPGYMRRRAAQETRQAATSRRRKHSRGGFRYRLCSSRALS